MGCYAAQKCNHIAGLLCGRTMTMGKINNRERNILSHLFHVFNISCFVSCSLCKRLLGSRSSRSKFSSLVGLDLKIQCESQVGIKISIF
ncbi:hypothetical protein K1719_023847 [Acacia pycnantha]|nr:hypothetical protein K1719_023847 [Acacia pycnantha]